jgi:hypothetical protein
MTEQNLIEQLPRLGLGAYFEQLKPHLLNAIHLKIIAQPESDIPIGVSKIGGLPDLPDTLAWPSETRIRTKRQFCRSEASLLHCPDQFCRNQKIRCR